MHDSLSLPSPTKSWQLCYVYVQHVPMAYGVLWRVWKLFPHIQQGVEKRSRSHSLLENILTAFQATVSDKLS